MTLRLLLPPFDTDAGRARLLELMTALSFEHRPVTLSSGRTSDFYIDSKQTVLTAEGHYLTGELLLDIVERDAPESVAIGGLTMGADPLASAVSLVSWQRGRPRAAFYVRKEPKGHGTGAWIEGARALPPGAPVTVLEDVITTGASALRAVERARLAGLTVVRIVALVDREEEGGREALAREAPVSALFTRRDFIK